MEDIILQKPRLFLCERIFRMLDEMWEKKVLFLTAPMGYGKTTIIREYLEQKKPELVEWFHLGNYENDMTMFLSRLDELYKLNGITIDFMTHRNVEKFTQCEMMEYAKILKEQMKKETVCVFEDYHLCKVHNLNRMIETLGYMNIPKLHIIIIGRFYPDMPYLEMQLKGVCELLGEQELRLRKEEIADFFAGNGIHLQEEELQQVSQYTDGWIAAVYLMCLEYMQNGTLEGNRSVANLIRTSIFQKLSQEEQRILTMLHQNTYCTPEQANFLTDNQQAASILFDLEKRIGFIHYLEDKGFSIHSMLRGIAKEQSFRMGISREALLEKNASWYLIKKDYLKAIPLLAELEKYEEIFEILEQKNVDIIYTQGLIILKEAYERMPIALKCQHLELYLLFIIYYLLKMDFHAAMNMFLEIKEYMKADLYEQENKILMCQISVLEMAYSINNVSAMNNISERFYMKMDEQMKNVYKKEMQKIFAVPRLMRVLHYKTGGFRESVMLLKEHFAVSERNVNEQVMQEKTIYEAEYYYETAQFSKAITYAGHMLLMAKLNRNPTVLIAAYSVLIHTNLALGEIDKVYEALEAMGQDMQEYQEEIFQQDYNLLKWNIYGSIRMVEEPEERLLDIDISRYSFVAKLSGTVQEVYGRMLCSERRYRELEVLALEMLNDMEKETYLFREIIGRIYLLIAHYHEGNVEEAQLGLEHVLALCSQDDIVMIFVENCMELSPILEVMELNTFGKKVLEQCRSCMKKIRKRGEEPGSSLTSLTVRETDILNLLILGMKNAEIADNLHIAQITVEKALSGIYRKLGVKNRAGASIKYQEMLRS